VPRVLPLKNANEECVYKDGVSGVSYMLLLVDPDAPTPDDPKFAFWRHWVLPGLQPAGQGVATQTKAPLTEYLGPGPKDEYVTRVYFPILSTLRCSPVCNANGRTFLLT
jgi:phosphatidylethanolamine-binding protein (PEBP) family uncharacterized protein